MRRAATLIVVTLACLLLSAGVATAKQPLTISLDPAQGVPGTHITVTGKGFDSCPDYGSGGVVRILWDGSTMIGETVREADGSIVEWVLAPDDAPEGQHTIYAQCYDGGEYATTTFTITSGTSDGGKAEPTTTTTTTTTSQQQGGGTSTSAATTTTTTPVTTTPGQSSIPATTTPPPATTTSAGEVPPPAGSDGTPPERSAWTAAVRTPGEVDWSIVAVLTSLAIGAVLILLIGFPAEVFNKTFEQNRDRIMAAFRWLPTWPSRVPALVQLLGFAALAAGLTALVDPRSGFDTGTLALVIGLFVAFVVTTLAYELPGEVYAWRVSNVPGQLRVVPLAVGIAVGCAVLSWAAGFVPGYTYGLFIAFFAARSQTREHDGRTVLLSSATMVVTSAAAWFFWEPVSTAAENGGGFGLLVLDAALCGTFVLGVQNLVFGLMPLRFMDGHHLFRWRGGYWTALYLVGVFGLVHVLLHPKTAPQGTDNAFTVTRALLLFVAFGLVSLAFWAYFRPRRGQMVQEPVDY